MGGKFGIGLLLLAFTAVGCGSGGETSGEASPTNAETTAAAPGSETDTDEPANNEELTTVRVAEVGGRAGSAPLSAAIEQGFFADHGLELELEAIRGGPTIVAAMLSGDVEIGGLAIGPVIAAACNQGHPVKAIAGRTQSSNSAEEEDTNIVVMADSGIETAADLEGKTIATTSTGSFGALAAQLAIAAEGGDPSAVQFVEMDATDMLGALTGGSVDAVQASEPFVTLAVDEGAERLLAYTTAAFGDEPVPIGGFAATDEFIANNPDIIDGFLAGLAEGLEWVKQNEDEVRADLAEELDPELAERIRLPTWADSVELQQDQVERLIGAMAEAGRIDDPDCAYEDVVLQR